VVNWPSGQPAVTGCQTTIHSPAQTRCGSPASVDARYRSASPFDLLPLGVPQILIHGTDDGSVPLELSERYHQAALAAGDRCDLMVLAGAGHFEVVDPRSVEWQRVLAAVHAMLSTAGG
jgi:pimeloyl-ACP methyl ester carboxylesterase